MVVGGTPPGKLIKRIVAGAGLGFDARDRLAHLLALEVGRGALAVPEGHASVPVVDHRLGLAESALLLLAEVGVELEGGDALACQRTTRCS